MLRFVPLGAVERADGGRPTSRGLPPAAFWGTGRLRGNGRRPPKRDSQGSGPLSGCGQSPPFSPRDGCVDAAASWSAGRHASVFPARLPTVPDGQSAPTPCSPPRQTKIRRANSEALLPRRGKQRRIRTPAAYPCPAGQGCVISPCRNAPAAFPPAPHNPPRTGQPSRRACPRCFAARAFVYIISERLPRRPLPALDRAAAEWYHRC